MRHRGVKLILSLILVLHTFNLGLALKCYRCEADKTITGKLTSCEAPSKNKDIKPEEVNCGTDSSVVCTYYTLRVGSVERFYRTACTLANQCDALRQQQGTALTSCKSCNQDLCGDESRSDGVSRTISRSLLISLFMYFIVRHITGISF